MNNEFEKITNEIINNNKYKELVNESHHGINRYDHCLRVAKQTYEISKLFKLNYESATRAALLHDFFSNADLKEETEIEKYRLHPYLAANNAEKYFNINSLEQDIIETHMYPITKIKPDTKEGMIVSIADKIVSLYEYSRYKFRMQISVIVVFLINVITLSNK